MRFLYSGDDELRSLAVIESVGRLDEPEVPLVQQVLERKTHVPVFGRDLHDKTEVRLDEDVAGVAIPLHHPLREVNFLLLAQEGVYADFREILR